MILLIWPVIWISTGEPGPEGPQGDSGVSITIFLKNRLKNIYIFCIRKKLKFLKRIQIYKIVFVENVPLPNSNRYLDHLERYLKEWFILSNITRVSFLTIFLYKMFEAGPAGPPGSPGFQGLLLFKYIFMKSCSLFHNK